MPGISDGTIAIPRLRGRYARAPLGMTAGACGAPLGMTPRVLRGSARNDSRARLDSIRSVRLTILKRAPRQNTPAARTPFVTLRPTTPPAHALVCRDLATGTARARLCGIAVRVTPPLPTAVSAD